MLGQARFCRGTGGNLGICHKNAQVCRTHAEFFLGKTGTVCLFNKRAGKAYKGQILSGVGTVRENQLPT